ncbi:MAG: RagB/SusD family nutrient uptake outer membrane protein [Saprospiraceae bacterium]|nr:RagB/SusD family nutrient uptake outer membrane protein [Saprospiraceae bacterium]
MKTKIYFLALLSILFIASCDKDFLNTVPNTSINEKDAFTTPKQFLAHVNDMYSQLQNPNYYGGRYIVFNEQRADEFGQNDGNAATGSAVWNQNVATTNEYINDVWAAAYRAINSANILLSQLEKTTVISDSLKKLYSGEAKFVRALCYLNLVQTYARPYTVDKSSPGVPLRLIAITSSGFNDLARSSVEEVYIQMIKDLDEAETLLPISQSSSYYNTIRARKASAIALKSRVYLNIARYDKVIEECSKIVSSVAPFTYSNGSTSLALESNLSQVFTGSYTGSESIFSIAFANSTTETPPSQFSLAFNYAVQPIIFMAKGGILKDSVFLNSDDARSKLTGVSKSGGHKILQKFIITTAPFRDYVPVMRYAEVLLNYSEALARNGNTLLSVEILNAIRHRSNSKYQFPSEATSSSDALINTILNERRIELLGEGLRLQDLQRLGKNLPAKTGSIGTAPEVPVTAKNYIWPIPSGELSTNKLCTPN